MFGLLGSRKKFSSTAVIESHAPTKCELDELQHEIATERAQLAEMEAEEVSVADELMVLEGVASQFKVSLSQGSPSAAPALDSLEHKRRAIERRREGLLLRIGSVRTALAAQDRRAIELAIQRNKDLRERELAEAKARCKELVELIVVDWRNACRNAFELISMLTAGMNKTLGSDPAQSTAAEEYRQFFRILNNEALERFLSASLEPVNSNWTILRRDLPHPLSIMPALPRRVAGKG